MRKSRKKTQPPSGGCVLKLARFAQDGFLAAQPPSGGCVLKPEAAIIRVAGNQPAAFGRLCVETNCWAYSLIQNDPAAFGRLCVETLI